MANQIESKLFEELSDKEQATIAGGAQNPQTELFERLSSLERNLSGLLKGTVKGVEKSL